MKMTFLIYKGQLTVSRELKVEVDCECVSDDRQNHSQLTRQNPLYVYQLQRKFWTLSIVSG